MFCMELAANFGKQIISQNEAEAQQKTALEEVTYETFILASKVFKEVMQTIARET